MPICPICNEEYPEDEMIGEVCVSCASIMNDELEFECLTSVKEKYINNKVL